MEPVCVRALRARSPMGYGALELLDEELLDEELLVVVELPRHGNSGPSLVQVLVELPPIVVALDLVEPLDVAVELLLSHGDPGIWFTQLEEDAKEPLIELFVTAGVVVVVLVLVVAGPGRVIKKMTIPTIMMMIIAIAAPAVVERAILSLVNFTPILC